MKLRVANRYLALELGKRIELSKEYKALEEKLEHLNKRFDIDRISDTPEAREVAEEIGKTNGRLKEILKELVPH
jgi:hypothetical protein